MPLETLSENHLISNTVFDAIYPDDLQRLSKVHWTPIEVALQASKWLVVKNGCKILDIGSGAGKFCFVGALSTKGHFTGVEKTKRLVDISRKIQKKSNIPNLEFINADIKTINFSKYTGFYFYNSFHELILETDTIENPVLIYEQLYYDYSLFLLEQFEKLPINTQLVTYYGHINQVPNSFRLLDSAFENELKLWIKTS